MVPVELEINFPPLRCTRDPELEARRGKPGGLPRLANQLDAGLLRSPSPLALVAGLARGDDVLPALAPALDDRDDVVQGELRLGELLAAVLADVAVPQENVGPREAHDVLLALERD